MRAVCGVVAIDSAITTLVTEAPSDRADHHGEHDRGKCHQGVHHAHQRLVEAREISGGRPDDRAADAGRDHHHGADRERGARAEHHAAQDVAAEMIGAEPVDRVGRMQPHAEIVAQRVERREPVGARRDDRHQPA